MIKSIFKTLMLSACMLTASAQNHPVFQKLTWNQAAEKAQNEGKIVVVDVMMKPMNQKAKQNKEKELRATFSQKDIAKFCEDNAVVIQMDMLTEEGKAFAPKMAMFMYPTYAFFMPNGDILGVVHPGEVQQEAAKFIQKGEKAMEDAKVKRANSRSIQFAELSLEEVLKKAKAEKKLVFVDAYTSWCQPCLLMLKNVFTLNNVADFYNENFINLKIDFSKQKELANKFGITGYPSFLFLNGDGKLVHMGSGYSNEEKFIGYGKEALKKAKGIEFIEDDWNLALQRAEKENKLIFVDCYTTWCGPCKMLAKTVFTDPDVANVFNEKFVCAKLDMEKEVGLEFKKHYGVSAYPTMFFINKKGEMVHTLVGGVKGEVLLAQAEKALNATGMGAMNARYEEGDRDAEFIKDYMVMLTEANNAKKAEAVCVEYLSQFDKSKLMEKENWDLFEKYMNDYKTDLFEYAWANREAFYQALQKEKVQRKLETVWAIGSNSFVEGRGEKAVFDKKGFDKFCKRLAKTDIPGRHTMIEDAKMYNAEKLLDWKTYIKLGSKKLKTGKVTDMQLFNWGLRINQQCADDALRQQAAKWFDEAVERCKKDEAEGKVSMFSYKSIFEGQAKDLRQPIKIK